MERVAGDALKSTQAHTALVKILEFPPPLFLIDYQKQCQDKIAQLLLVVKMLKIKDAEGQKLQAEMEEVKKALAQAHADAADVVAKSSDVVMRVLSAIKDASTNDAVAPLQIGHVDGLMKYVYRLLETGENNSNVLLKWHEQAFKKGGHGCIVRALIESPILPV
eukprot:TRINITY_DN1250_c0_g1_i4.p1 TRINITY_DN1250_c0_g1~~TRINITY_DN1250_c0_g1_i4.p1  ORF type:complete len:164 (-),score=73.50 TRINITY_DN1250_c0_g1_i4:78-569(-)